MYLVSITLWLFKRFRVEGFVLSVLRGGEGLSSTSGNRRTTSCKEGRTLLTDRFFCDETATLSTMNENGTTCLITQVGFYHDVSHLVYEYESHLVH